MPNVIEISVRSEHKKKIKTYFTNVRMCPKLRMGYTMVRQVFFPVPFPSSNKQPSRRHSSVNALAMRAKITNPNVLHVLRPCRLS